MTNDRIALMLHQNAERFARLRAPSPEDRARFEKQLLENIDLVSDEHLRAIAGTLAPLETTPLEVAHFLCEVEETIAAPFIARSPVLDDQILLDIIARHGAGARTRAIARRRALTGPVRAGLRTLEDPAIDRALELRQTARPSEPVRAPGQPRGTIAQRLDAEVLGQVATLAGIESRPLFETALADSTGLSMTSARILCDDPTSRNFLFALRFMGFADEQALSVFRGLAPDLAADDDVEERFRQAYRLITSSEAAERVRGWQLDEIRSLATLQPASQDEPPSQERQHGAA